MPPGSDLDWNERLARIALTASLVKRIERLVDSAALAFGARVFTNLRRSEPPADFVRRARSGVGGHRRARVTKPSKIIAMTKRLLIPIVATESCGAWRCRVFFQMRFSQMADTVVAASAVYE